jgi:hypothetical protein
VLDISSYFVVAGAILYHVRVDVTVSGQLLERSSPIYNVYTRTFVDPDLPSYDSLLLPNEGIHTLQGVQEAVQVQRSGAP